MDTIHHDVRVLMLYETAIQKMLYQSNNFILLLKLNKLNFKSSITVFHINN